MYKRKHKHTTNNKHKEYNLRLGLATAPLASCPAIALPLGPDIILYCYSRTNGHLSVFRPDIILYYFILFYLTFYYLILFYIALASRDIGPVVFGGDAVASLRSCVYIYI